MAEEVCIITKRSPFEYLQKNSSHIEVLARLHECIGKTIGVGRRNVDVHIASNQEQIALEVLCQLLIGLHTILIFVFGLLVAQAVGNGLLHFAHTIVALHPATVVDSVVVIARARHGCLVGPTLMTIIPSCAIAEQWFSLSANAVGTKP